MTLRPTRETVLDTARDLERQGHIVRRAGAAGFAADILFAL